jgi:hypothetical protein
LCSICVNLRPCQFVVPYVKTSSNSRSHTKFYTCWTIRNFSTVFLLFLPLFIFLISVKRVIIFQYFGQHIDIFWNYLLYQLFHWLGIDTDPDRLNLDQHALIPIRIHNTDFYKTIRYLPCMSVAKGNTKTLILELA